MKKIELADATAPLAEYVRCISQEPVLVTENGKPLAVLVLPEDVDLESLTLATDPWFIGIIERSRERHQREGGLSLEEVRREFGLEKAPQAEQEPPPKPAKASPAQVGTPPKARRRNS